jgi:uncharacterized protein (DUF1778 family)
MSGRNGSNMDEALRAKLDEARKSMNTQQAVINANRKDDDRAMREWARGKQRLANVVRDQFRISLTDEDRRQVEERMEQLVHENPALSLASDRTPDTKTEPSVDVLEEYHFLRDVIA